MPTATFEYSTEAERLSIEHAIAFASEMHQLALDVPHGTVLDACEQQAVERGPAFLRQTLQNALQARMDVADAKKGRAGAVRVEAPSTKNGRAQKG